MTTPQPLAGALTPGRSIESVLLNRWARLLIPSLSDLFFLAILVWLFMCGGATGWQGLLEDGDAGWHIRTGEYILSHGAVPQKDLYSFSKSNAPWYAWEWGTDVLDALLHRSFGLKGVVLFAALMIGLFALSLVRRMAWRGVHAFTGLVVALLGVGASSIHFLARPHIFTLVFMSVGIWLVEKDRREQSESSARWLWLLVPLTAVWTNLHGGFLAMIAALGVATLGEAVEGWMIQRWARPLRYAALTAACGLASLANPYGYQLHVHVHEYLKSDWIKEVVQEFQSPSFRNENMMQFEALLLVGLMVACTLLARRRIVEGLWILFFAHMSLTSARHVPVFIAVATPSIALQLSEWWAAATAAARKNSLAGIINAMAADSLAAFRRTSIWPLAAAAALIATGAPIQWPQDFPDLIFPSALVDKHSADIFGHRVLTSDQWADYLIYRNPTQKVFVDGRSDFYGPEVGNQYIRLINGGTDWKQILDKYEFDRALLSSELAVVQLLRTLPDWRLVEENGKRVFFVREPQVRASLPPR